MRLGLGGIGVVILLLSCGCGGVAKRKNRVDIPPAYLIARGASLKELVELINHRYAGIETIRVSHFDVEFKAGSIENGYFEKYPRANGYLVAQAPDSMLINILHPLISSTVVVMAAQGENFQIWHPSENKYVTGSTTIQFDRENPLFNVRPHHLLQGMFVERIATDSLHEGYFLEEDQDAEFKYYVLGVLELQKGKPTLRLIRRLWIERSTMHLVRQQYYREGELISTIRYRQPIELGNKLINSEIEVARTRESYQILLNLGHKDIEVDQPIKPEVFEVPMPPGAELVVVRRKEVSTDP